MFTAEALPSNSASGAVIKFADNKELREEKVCLTYNSSYMPSQWGVTVEGSQSSSHCMSRTERDNARRPA